MPKTPRFSVALRLEPAKLENPDLELRWELERRLKNHLPDLEVVEDGFGFCRHSDAMLISYASVDAGRVVAALVQVLENEEVLGNRLANGAMLATAPAESTDFAEHVVVYPTALAGTPLPD